MADKPTANRWQTMHTKNIKEQREREDKRFKKKQQQKHDEYNKE
jgi:hypothetical protein